MSIPTPKQVADARAMLAAVRKARKAQRAPRVQHAPQKASRGRELDAGYLAFLRRQPCEARHLGGCSGRIDPAHLRFGDASVGRINPGLSKKSHDRWAVSLCRTHHEAQHAHGNERRWWSDIVRRDPNAIAIARYAAFKGEPG